MARFVKVIATLSIAGSEEPVPAGTKVSVIDIDPIVDDPLGEAVVVDGGGVELFFGLDAASSVDSPFETYPDIAFHCEVDGINYQSQVIGDVDYWSPHSVTGLRHDGTVNLGKIELVLV